MLGHRSALAAKDRIGYLPEERGVYRKMRVGAFLTYMAPEGLARRTPAPREPAARARRPGGTENKRCEDLSKGMLQRVQFVSAIIHQPDLLILDEPFSGLDPVSVRLLRELIVQEHRRGATILFSTHVMSHAEEICQHVVMIHRGRKVLDEPDRRSAAPVRSPDDSCGAARSRRGRVRAWHAAGVERVDRSKGVGRWCSPRAPIRRGDSRLAAGVPVARIELSRLRSRMCSWDRVGRRSGQRCGRALRAGLQGPGEGAVA